MIQITALAAPGFLPSASDLSFRVSDFNIISLAEILQVVLQLTRPTGVGGL